MKILISSYYNASQVQRQEHGALLLNHIVMEELVQPWKTQPSVRSTTTAIALCRLGARGVRVLTPVEQVGYKRACFLY